MARDDFSNDNPFRSLQSKNFPQKRGGSGHAVIRKTQKMPATPEEDENALFLNAVESLHVSHKGCRPLSSWSLEDAGIDFSAMVKVSSNKKRGASGSHGNHVEGPQAKDVQRSENGEAGNAFIVPDSSAMAASDAPVMPPDDDAAVFWERMGEVTPLAVKGRSVLPPRHPTPSSPAVNDNLCNCNISSWGDCNCMVFVPSRSG